MRTIKFRIFDSEIKKYISRKTDAIQNQFKELNITLIDDEKDVERYASKKSKTTAPKKSTVQETYELWVEKKSIADIATIRVLTKQTIYAHFVQLIQTKAVSISEVLPEDKIQTLAAAFNGYKEESLNALMEKNSEKFKKERLLHNMCICSTYYVLPSTIYFIFVMGNDSVTSNFTLRSIETVKFTIFYVAWV